MDIGKIAKEAIKIKCPVHGEYPTFKKEGESVNFSTCCKDFGKRIANEFNKKVGEEIKKEIGNIFKK